MKKSLLFIATLMGLISSNAWNDFGHFTGIINKSPYNAIQIQTSDQAGTVTLKDGSKWSGGQIKNKSLHLWDLASFNLTIPLGHWDSPANIYIDVKRDITINKTLVMRGVLQERNGNIELLTGKSKWKGNHYDDSPLKKVQSLPRHGDTNYTLLIDEIGDMRIVTKNAYGDLITTTNNSPPQVTFAFNNGYPARVVVGSPNCSIEKDINKQYITVEQSAQWTEYSMYMKEGCKLVVTDTNNGITSTACFGFAQGKDKKGRWIPTNQKNPYNFHEVNCTDPECAPDDLTGISPCDNLHITWVEGNDPKTQNLVRVIGPNHIKRFYGITTRK